MPNEIIIKKKQLNNVFAKNMLNYFILTLIRGQDVINTQSNKPSLKNYSGTVMSEIKCANTFAPFFKSVYTSSEDSILPNFKKRPKCL